MSRDHRTLHDYARSRGPVPYDEVSSIVMQIADALHAAHVGGVVHGNVRLESVTYDPATRRASLADLGVHGRTDGFAGFIVGTLAWVAPEAISEGDPTSAADQYSLAVVAFFLLTGRLPFSHTAPRELFAEILSQAPIPLNAANPALQFSPAVERVIMRGMHRESAKRYPDVLSFARELAAAPSRDEPS